MVEPVWGSIALPHLENGHMCTRVLLNCAVQSPFDRLSCSQNFSRRQQQLVEDVLHRHAFCLNQEEIDENHTDNIQPRIDEVTS